MLAARLATSRRLPQVTFAAKRFTSSIKEGSVASSKGFKEKESAHENEYARKKEALELQKLRAEIEKKKLELEELEKKSEQIKK
ncbi:hypothetical protein Moror_6716 [Moniliophthora roreri MCA 2997]|uniref:ATPase inhibitor, mitochondrial n=2 Tax=Moniliophthora roreri TaxID=221103 RepID=V2YYD3_MONRO|nr:hypothetical protein Moror_6716 [Moniliophthora roreri MCA 2997]KAI3612704.1 hypothetical protein WG66_014745 [Moniliophthora roreri]